MSIFLMVQGSLYRAPESHTSTKGKAYVRARMAVRDGESKTWITMTAFDRIADELLRLHEGEGLSVAGRATVKPYTDKAGEPAASLDVLVDRLIRVYPPRVRTDVNDDKAHADVDLDADQVDDAIPF